MHVRHRITRVAAGLQALAFVCLVSPSTAVPAQNPGAPNAPPNVVLIISDDQAWTDYGFMGHPVIRTPRLDRLAAESATFTRGYVPSSLCRPSLATMITGRYPSEHRITGNDPSPPTGVAPRQLRTDPDYRALCERLIGNIERVPTLPRWLAERGYVSHQSGKWWEGNYRRGGFTHGMTHGDPSRGGRHGDVGLGIGRDGLQPVLDFMDEAGADQKPFFVWYAPFLPHTPHNPPERFLRKYTQSGRPEALAKYYAMCEWFDETCGQLLDALDERGIADNTLVVYVTDNGWIQRTPETEVPDGWNQQFAPRSKQSPFEGGLRTPIMLRWPGKIEPRKLETLVSSIDIAPTILAACGLAAPKDLPGVNLLDVCDGRAVDRQRIQGEVYTHDVIDLDDPLKGLIYRWCIEDQWKLIVTRDVVPGRYRPIHPQTTGEHMLFDLEADPHETRNLADEKPDVVARLKRALQ